MNNTALAGIIVGAVVIVTAGAVAANSGYNPLQDYATVVSVEPAFETSRTPRQVCGDQTTLEQAPVKDEKRIAGTAIGAVVGGVLGSQVGSGSGRDAATVAGAAAGGYAGSKVQKRLQEGNLQEKTEENASWSTTPNPYRRDSTSRMSSTASRRSCAWTATRASAYPSRTANWS